MNLPFEPVEEWARLHWPECESLADLGNIFHVSAEAVRLWRRDGVTVWRADDIAVTHMGRMPWEVWGDWERYADELCGKEVTT